jgi:hypothetical protein
VGLTHRALRKAACSAHGSHFDRLNAPPSGWSNKSDLSDFHELRQGFSPPNRAENQTPEQLLQKQGIVCGEYQWLQFQVEIFMKRIILKPGIYPMGAFASEDFLDQLIHNQRRAIRYYVFFVAGLVVLGILVIALAFVSPAWLPAGASFVPDVIKGLFGVGGSFVLSLSGFQVKEILSRREKIQGFETLKEQLKNLKGTPKAERVRAQKRIEELMWKYIERTALS